MAGTAPALRIGDQTLETGQCRALAGSNRAGKTRLVL